MMNHFELLDSMILIKPLFFIHLTNMLFKVGLLLIITERTFILNGHFSNGFGDKFFERKCSSKVFDGF